MKTWSTFLFLLCHASFLASQPCLPGGISFSSQESIDLFNSIYPDCTEIEGIVWINLGSTLSGVYDLTGLQNITTIGGRLIISDVGATNTKEDLTGLENLTTIGGNLEINVSSGLGFESLHGLEGLTSIGGDLILLETEMNDFSGLNNLKSIGGRLRIEQSLVNNFQGLSQLDTIHGGIYTTASSFDDFSGLNALKSIVGSLDILGSTFNSFQGFQSLNSITGTLNMVYLNPPYANVENFVGLDQLTTVGSIRVTGSKLKDFTGLDNLKTIDANLDLISCDSLISLNGLEQVESIGGDLFFIGNNYLASINALANTNLTGITYLQISNNELLTLCESAAICNYLNNGGYAYIEDNGSGCSELEEFLAKCDETLSKVQYFPYYDQNQNQTLDNNEVLYTDVSIQVDPNNYLNFSNSDIGGTLYLEPGDYVLTLMTNDLWELSTPTNSYPVNITEANTCDSIYFGVFPLVLESQLVTTIQSPPTRCLEFITFEVMGKNNGTSVESGTLWLDVDPEILDVAFIDQPDTVVAPYRYGWHFNELFPSQTVSRLISLQIPGPPDFQLGNMLSFFSYIDFVDQSWVQNASGFRYTPIVACSYDPNDKFVHPNRDGNYTLFDEWLIYTVRFQNTGNDLAYDVVIRDTLDANLDASSFLILGSSHETELSTTLEDGQFLTFDFSNIFLPDSTTDLEGSQGYVSYLIKGKEGLAENTAIENTASIYFDLNPPIVTNTTQSIMVSELPTTSVENIEGANDWFIFPNPSQGSVQIVNEKALNARLSIWNSNGQKLMDLPFHQQKTLDLDTLPAGVYWVRLQTESEYSGQKLVKW